MQVSLLLEFNTKFDDKCQDMNNHNDILFQQLNDKDKSIQNLCNFNQILIQTINEIINSKGSKEEVIYILQKNPQTCSKETIPAFLLLISKLKGIGFM